MHVSRGLAVIGLATMSAALAADALLIRPGRWEVTAQLDFGGRELPAGMPLAEPMKQIACVTEEELRKWNGFIPPPDANCKVLNFKSTGKEISYTAQCEDAAMDLKATIHSPDSYSGISTSHGQDPSQRMTMKFSGKRVGEACSAKELAEDAEEDTE